MWQLKNGERVVDRHQSHLHAAVEGLLPEALGRIDAAGRDFLVDEVDFGRLIGETTCVATGPDDAVVYAKRPKRFGLSRFVKNRRPEPCSSVVVILKKAEDFGGYVLITAFVGRRSEPEPWDRNATANSLPFWNSHALVWGSEPTIPGTETTRCPW
ncbi:MAG: hypothetical protein BWY14_00954 [Parcubacteria group bacterium ADurb.Bin192]|nr:MAG: hypothetical protein BWY14_00954 [Parcubacteria group bacterium ADurb.Bin192]